MTQSKTIITCRLCIDGNFELYCSNNTFLPIGAYLILVGLVVLLQPPASHSQWPPTKPPTRRPPPPVVVANPHPIAWPPLQPFSSLEFFQPHDHQKKKKKTVKKTTKKKNTKKNGEDYRLGNREKGRRGNVRNGNI